MDASESMERGLVIIGPGAVGRAWGRRAVACGWPVVAVAGRDLTSARDGARHIGADMPVLAPEEAAARGSQVLIATPDSMIEGVCRRLAEARAFRNGATVFHCSGALASDVLGAARDGCGACIASAHPLQTFPDRETGAERMEGTFFFCEGDPEALATLGAMIPLLGGRMALIRSGGKALYHAAAVMACNYLTALMDSALFLAGAAGLERSAALEALMPLVRSTLDGIEERGTAEALTGPIQRGDVVTVCRHLAAFRDLPDGTTGAAAEEVAALYRALGRWTLGVANRGKMLSPEAHEALCRLLREGAPLP